MSFGNLYFAALPAMMNPTRKVDLTHLQRLPPNPIFNQGRFASPTLVTLTARRSRRHQHRCLIGRGYLFDYASSDGQLRHRAITIGKLAPPPERAAPCRNLMPSSDGYNQGRFTSPAITWRLEIVHITQDAKRFECDQNAGKLSVRPFGLDGDVD